MYQRDQNHKPELNTVDLLLAIRCAFLGEFFWQIRGITLDWSDHQILIRVVVDGELTQDDLLSLERVHTRVKNIYPLHIVILDHLRLDEPSPWTKLRVTEYGRRETWLSKE